MTRVETVFYQFDWREEPRTIANLCRHFQPLYPDDVKEEDRIMKAKYTPNFDQEIQKYHDNKILGIKFNWRE